MESEIARGLTQPNPQSRGLGWFGLKCKIFKTQPNPTRRLLCGLGWKNPPARPNPARAHPYHISLTNKNKRAKDPFVPLTFAVIFSYASNVSFVSIVPPMWNVSFNYASNFNHPQKRNTIFRTIWARFWSDFIWVLIFGHHKLYSLDQFQRLSSK